MAMVSVVTLTFFLAPPIFQMGQRPGMGICCRYPCQRTVVFMDGLGRSTPGVLSRGCRGGESFWRM